MLLVESHQRFIPLTPLKLSLNQTSLHITEQNSHFPWQQKTETGRDRGRKTERRGKYHLSLSIFMAEDTVVVPIMCVTLNLQRGTEVVSSLLDSDLRPPLCILDGKHSEFRLN